MPEQYGYVRVQAPDGSHIDFPDTMQDAEIETAMGKLFPPPEKGFFQKVGEVAGAVGRGLAAIPEGGRQLVTDVLDKGLPTVAQEMFTSAGEGANREWSQAGEHLRQGDPMGVLTHVAGALVPVLGPAINQAGSDIASPDPQTQLRGVEGATSALSTIAAPFIGEEAAAAFSRVRGAAKAPFTANPEIAAQKAFGFPKAQPESAAKVARGAGEIVDFGGPLPKDAPIEQRIWAAKKTIANHEDVLDAYFKRAQQMGTRVSGDGIVQSTREAIPSYVWQEDPLGAQALVDKMQRAYGGKTFSTNEFRDFLIGKNAEAKGYYGKSAAVQRASELTGSDPAMMKAHADAIRQALYPALDPETGGENVRNLQSRIGDVIETRNALESVQGKVRSEQPTTQAEGAMRRVYAAADVPGRFFTGKLERATNRWKTAFRSSTEQLIDDLFNSAPRAGRLPEPSVILTAPEPSVLPQTGTILNPWVGQIQPKPTIGNAMTVGDLMQR